MRKLPIGLGFSFVLATSASALAEEKPQAAPPAGTAAASTPPSAAPAAPKDDVRRDPKGKTGISPFMELIVKGDRAFLARDFDLASATYREAIQIDPQNPLGQLRMGWVQLRKGDAKEAEAAFVTGLRFADKDAAIKAKLLFALAELEERQGKSDDAALHWKAYAKVGEENKETLTYPATASERVLRNEAWKKTRNESIDVKARIERRLKEADEAARKSATDPKNK
jgi:tetratricopeptide (TPR) repeat protein